MKTEIDKCLIGLKTILNDLNDSKTPKEIQLELRNFVLALNDPQLKGPLCHLEKKGEEQTQELFKLDKIATEELQIKLGKTVVYIEKIDCAPVVQKMKVILASDVGFEIGSPQGFFFQVKELLVFLLKNMPECRGFIETLVTVDPGDVIDDESISPAFNAWKMVRKTGLSEIPDWRCLLDLHWFLGIIEYEPNKVTPLNWVFHGPYSERVKVLGHPFDKPCANQWFDYTGLKFAARRVFRYLEKRSCGALPEDKKLTRDQINIRDSNLCLDGFGEVEFKKGKHPIMLLRKIAEDLTGKCQEEELYKSFKQWTDEEFLKPETVLFTETDKRALEDLVSQINDRIANELWIKDFLVYNKRFVYLNPLILK